MALGSGEHSPTTQLFLFMTLLLVTSPCLGVLRSGFLSFGTVHILGQLTLCYGRCPEHSWIFISIPGFYPLDANRLSHPPPNCDNQKCLQTLLNVSLGAKPFPAEKHCSRLNGPPSAAAYILFLTFSLCVYSARSLLGWYEFSSHNYLGLVIVASIYIDIYIDLLSYYLT